MINKFFDKIYVINLKFSEKRWKNVVTRLNKYQIKYERFEAISGEALKFLSNFDSILNKKKTTTKNKHKTLGCALSHLTVIANSLDYERVLILEDDFIINKNIHTIFNNSNLPPNYDVLYFGFIPLTPDHKYWNYNLVNKPYNENIYYALNFCGGYAYSPSRQIREEILKFYSKDFTYEVDHYLTNVVQPRGNSFAFVPQLIAVDDVISDREGILYDMKSRSIDTRFAKIEDYE